MSFAEAKAAFLQYLVVIKGVSKHTIQSYQTDLGHYFDYFEKTHGFSTLDEIVAEDVSDFLAHFGKTGHGARSQARCIATMHTFYKFLIAEQFVTKDPWQYIKMPKFNQKLPQYLTVEETFRLLQGETDTKKEAYPLRNRTMIELLYATGMRVSELSHIKLDDLSSSAQTIRVNGKGNKDRLIPIIEETLETIESYVQHERHLLDVALSPYLFLNRDGGMMSRQSIWKLIKQRAKAVGISKEISPHVLRHTFATHLLENGVNLKIVQDLLGHEDITTTQIYTHINQKKLFAIYRHAHPHNKVDDTEVT